LRDRTFLAVCALNLGLALVLWQSASALPLDIKRAGFSAIDYGLIMGVNGVMIVVLQPWLRGRLALFPRTHVLACGTLLFGVGFGLYGAVHSFLGYCLATAAWTLAEIAVLPLGSAVVADLSPPALRGRYQGMYSVSWGLASSLGPIVGNGVLARAGGQTLWLGCAVLMVLVAVGHLIVGPARARREHEALGAAFLTS
jgi:dipeptide/tripeptide permease